jgi:hypothetical protein
VELADKGTKVGEGAETFVQARPLTFLGYNNTSIKSILGTNGPVTSDEGKRPDELGFVREERKDVLYDLWRYSHRDG